jgi:hypothetical protein
MAHEGQVISNSRTGQRMIFIELRDELRRIDSVTPRLLSASRFTSTRSRRAGPRLCRGHEFSRSLASSDGWLLGKRYGCQRTRRTASGTTATRTRTRSSADDHGSLSERHVFPRSDGWRRSHVPAA